MTRLMALYPRAWRDRYELEFSALLAERPSDPRDRIDIVRGAIDARLHPQLGRGSPSPGSSRRTVRLGASLAVLGGALWTASAFAFRTSLYDADVGYKDTDSALVVAIASALVTGLAALAIARSLPGRNTLASIAAFGPVVGALAMAMPWPILLAGFMATIIGSALFGLVTFPRLGASGIFLAVAALLAFDFNTEDERALLLVPLGVAWVLVGIVLTIRREPAPVDSPVSG